MKLSLSKRIENYCRKQYPNWVNGGEIERLAMATTHKVKGIMVPYKASNASRRCRELTSGVLSNGVTCPVVLEEKVEGSVWYRYKPREKVVQRYEIKEVNGKPTGVLVEKVITV